MSQFEKASRVKLRFGTSLGQLSIEDLWDLPLTSVRKVSLNSIAQGVHREIQESSEINFVASSGGVNTTLQLKMDIVKHIIEVRVGENEAKSNQLAKTQRNERIQELIANKKDEELSNQSVEDLEKLLEA